MSDVILSVKKFHKNYGRFEAVKGISFEVHKGEIFGLIGPNGAGKSTTLRTIATIINPTSGSITINGSDLVKRPEACRSIISYLPEEAGAYKNLSGIGYLKFMAELYAKSTSEAKQFVEYGKEISGLGVRLKDKIKSYSKGMTRKILLARTVMSKSPLAILDEPTSGLDVINAFEIRKTIKKLASEGMSVLLSSHNMLEIEFLSDRVAIIDRGEILETGTPSELKNKHKANNLEEVFVKVAV